MPWTRFLWFQEGDLFIGDVALTEERSNFVEFSFITQADSGAFVTHAPRKLNEALALLRPFQWEVSGLCISIKKLRFTHYMYKCLTFLYRTYRVLSIH